LKKEKQKKFKLDEEALSLRIERLLERANAFHESKVEPNVLADRELYLSSKEHYRKKFPKVSRISEIVTSDVANTIEWAIPGVMRVFYASDDIFTVQGVDPKDDEAAKIHKSLNDYYFQRNADGFLLFYDWIKLSMKERVSFIKCYWEKHEEEELLEVDVNQEELSAMQAGGFKIQQITPSEEGNFTVKYTQMKTLKNEPKFDVVSVAQLRWSPEATSLSNSNFVAERMVVDMDYLRRREKDGFFKNVNKIKPGDMQYTLYEQSANSMQQRDGEDDQEEALKPIALYEIYMRTDIDGDGLAEDVVVHWCNKQILKVQENTMGCHPYFGATPIREPKSIYPIKGFAELLGELQDIKTALLRQIIANVAINNDKQAFVNVDVLVDVNEFVQGKKAVRVNGNPRDAVYYMPAEPIPPQVFTLFEFLESNKESQTGVTRYNQGQDASSLNKTATGITQIMGAANQRLEMIVRIIAEGGVKPMLKHLIRMSQMYLTDEMTIRVANKPLPFRPEDLDGNIDVIVNAGVGTGVKQTQIQNLQLLISLYQLVMQAGAADPSHLSFAFRKLVEELGFKNVDDFSMAPDAIKQQMQAQAEAQAQQQQMMDQMKQRMLGGTNGESEAGGATGAGAAGTITPGGDGQIDPRLLEAMAG
jgi:hypothetical protein